MVEHLLRAGPVLGVRNLAERKAQPWHQESLEPSRERDTEKVIRQVFNCNYDKEK